jgi:hypothetical protein
MFPKIINLTLQLVIKEIEDILEHYPEHPYQIAFSINELRQQLITHVMKQIPNYYAIIENVQDLPEDPRCLYASSEEQVLLENLICNSITDVLLENTDLISHRITSSNNSNNESSVWIG